MTQTSSFGASKRENHDSSDFYERNLYDGAFGLNAGQEDEQYPEENPDGEDRSGRSASAQQGSAPPRTVQPKPLDEWANRIYCHDSQQLNQIPDNSVALAFTSPPYNVGKDYEDDIDMASYLSLIQNVGAEVFRVLKPGGRYVINIANLGRKPYIPLHALFYDIHMRLDFLPMGEIIWQKGKGANGSCAWGSWKSAKSPRLRDIHEYLLVFAKENYSRPEAGVSTIERDDFMDASLSIWHIQPESAKRVGHPAPFPLELADRVINFYSYQDDVVLDPFNGSGTTCLAARNAGRHYVGFELSHEYCQLAEARLAEERLAE